MIEKIIVALAIFQCVVAETTTTYTQYQQPTQQQQQAFEHIARSGFGVNANAGFQDGGFGVQGGVNTPLGGFQGNVGLGQGGSGVNNNLLMTVVIGLGFLSFLNIVVQVVTPWMTGLAGDDKPADGEKPAEKGRRYQRNINYMAENVLNLIESFSKKNE